MLTNYFFDILLFAKKNGKIRKQMSSNEQPLMILLTGPNGAGKTTFRQKFLDTNPTFNGMNSLNWDDETYRLTAENPKLPETTARINAGKNIIEQTRYCLSQSYSFIYETVAADRRHLRIINTAQNAFYKVVTVFIGLSSPELSKQRVKHRVENGGHDVPVKDIETRYPKIMANFPVLFNQSDTCFVIDNSGKNFKLVLLKSNNINITFSRFPNYLPNNQFDLTKEIQPNGSILLQTSEYVKKTQAEKQKIIQQLLETFSIKNL